MSMISYIQNKIENGFEKAEKENKRPRLKVYTKDNKHHILAPGHEIICDYENNTMILYYGSDFEVILKECMIEKVEFNKYPN